MPIKRQALLHEGQIMETTPVVTTKRTVKSRASKATESKVGSKAAATTSAKPVKVKAIAVTKAATPVAKTRVKTPAKPRVKKALTVNSTPSVMAHSEAEILHMIAEAAYYMAEHRCFTPGDELHDWLMAEQEIRSQYQHA
jgi:hypothetical protein